MTGGASRTRVYKHVEHYQVLSRMVREIAPTCLCQLLANSSSYSNNMLYPKEDTINRILLFACRNCDHQEDAIHNCVYRNNIITHPM